VLLGGPRAARNSSNVRTRLFRNLSFGIRRKEGSTLKKKSAPVAIKDTLAFELVSDRHTQGAWFFYWIIGKEKTPRGTQSISIISGFLKTHRGQWSLLPRTGTKTQDFGRCGVALSAAPPSAFLDDQIRVLPNDKNQIEPADPGKPPIQKLRGDFGLERAVPADAAQ